MTFILCKPFSVCHQSEGMFGATNTIKFLFGLVLMTMQRDWAFIRILLKLTWWNGERAGREWEEQAAADKYTIYHRVRTISERRKVGKVGQMWNETFTWDRDRTEQLFECRCVIESGMSAQWIWKCFKKRADGEGKVINCVCFVVCLATRIISDHRKTRRREESGW